MKQFRCAVAPMLFVLLAANCGCGGGDDGSASRGTGSGGDANSSTPGANDSGAVAGAGGSIAGGSGASSSVGGAGGSLGTGGTPATGGAAGNTGGTNAAGGAAGSTGGTNATGGTAGNATGGSAGVAPAISAVAWIDPDSCERMVPYEVRDVRDQAGLPVADYTCQWTFTDLTVSNTCAGERVFGDAPNTHQGTVVVRDSRTGATTTATSESVYVIEPLGLDIYTDAFDCMQFSYDVDRQYGCAGGTHTLDIQPAENILTPGPWSLQGGTLQVSTPGVYTLHYSVVGYCEPRKSCSTSASTAVTVEPCP